MTSLSLGGNYYTLSGAVHHSDRWNSLVGISSMFYFKLLNVGICQAGQAVIKSSFFDNDDKILLYTDE